MLYKVILGIAIIGALQVILPAPLMQFGMVNPSKVNPVFITVCICLGAIQYLGGLAILIKRNSGS